MSTVVSTITSMKNILGLNPLLCFFVLTLHGCPCAFVDSLWPPKQSKYMLVDELEVLNWTYA